MKLQTRSAAGLLILGAILAGCGGAAATPAVGSPGQTSSAPAGQPSTAVQPSQGVQPSAAGATIDACALLTEKEATAFLGTDPGAGVNTGSADSPACAYGASLTMGVDPTGGKAAYDAMMASVPGSANGHVLTGVGDEAAVTIVANTIAAMGILKGSKFITVNVQGDPSLGNITVDTLTTLGKTIAGRL